MEFILKEVEYGSVSCVQIYTANFIRIMSPSDFVNNRRLFSSGFFFFFFWKRLFTFLDNPCCQIRFAELIKRFHVLLRIRPPGS